MIDRPKAISGEDPCRRLYFTPTMSFLRRCNADNKPPADSLDLKLGSVCNQENDWPISIEETVKQPITCSKKRHNVPSGQLDPPCVNLDTYRRGEFCY
ncbi:uncharacterized protein TNCV_2586601 [Trichonephila clavipes]|nr:uncharacterized protein TNCV_2586601 [Trichonephila clavipes]